MKLSFLQKKLPIKFGKKSIFYKYLKKLSFYMLIPLFVLNIIIYFLANSNYTNRQISDILNNSERTLETFNQFYYDYNKKYQEILTNTNTSIFMELDDISKCDAYLSNIGQLKDILSFNYVNNNFVETINLYSETNGYVLSKMSSNFLKYSKYPQWINNVSINNKMNIKYHNGSIILSSFIKSGTAKGAVGVFINHKKLVSDINTHSDTSEVFLYNCTHDKFISPVKNLPSEIQNRIKAYKFKKENFKYKNYYVTYSPSDITGVALVCVNTLPYGANNYVLSLTISSCLISLILALLMSYWMTQHYYLSSSNIVSELDTISPQKNDQSSDEMMYIANSIASLYADKQDIEKNLAEKASQLKQYQSIVLQNQIKPHFIYNVINTVNAMIMCECTDERPIEMLSLLCELMCTVYDTNNYLVTIKKEIEYTEVYIDIMKIKYNKPIDVIWEVDESLLGSIILKFTLQPIIENAFKHGILPAYNIDKAVISIKIFRHNNEIYMVIQNNGIPISNDSIKDLTEKLKNDDVLQTNHIGLINVHKRLKIYFGDKYGIIGIKADSSTTSIQIIIPNIEDTK